MPAKKNATLLLFGSIASVCMILFVVITWRTNAEAFVGWQIWVGRCIVLLLAAIAAVVEKKVRGGGIGFRSALKVTYGVLVMAIVAQSLFVWLIPNVFDPAFYHRLVPILLANTEKSYRRFGATDDQIRLVLDDIRTNNQFSLGRVISGTGYQLVLFFVIAVLIAATVKSKKIPTSSPKP